MSLIMIQKYKPVELMKLQLQWELQLLTDVLGQRHYCYIRVLHLIDQFYIVSKV